jgi:hypothetical protein
MIPHPTPVTTPPPPTWLVRSSTRNWNSWFHTGARCRPGELVSSSRRDWTACLYRSSTASGKVHRVPRCVLSAMELGCPLRSDAATPGHAMIIWRTRTHNSGTGHTGTKHVASLMPRTHLFAQQHPCIRVALPWETPHREVARLSEHHVQLTLGGRRVRKQASP